MAMEYKMIKRGDGSVINYTRPKGGLARATTKEITEYIQNQALLMMEINSRAVAAGRKAPFDDPRNDALKYEIVPKNDGTISLTKRAEKLEFFGDDESARVASQMTGYAEHVMKPTRGKYNDEDALLMMQDGPEIATGESQSWAKEF